MAKSYCNNCIYSSVLSASTTRVCNYLLATGKIRPCPAGEGSTVKETRKGRRRKKGAENG